MELQVPTPEHPTEIEGPDGEVLLFKHFQLVEHLITSFDSRIHADMKTARASHQGKVEMARQRFRGVEGIDEMMVVIREWTEGAEVDDSGRHLQRYGKYHTVLAIESTFMGVAGEDGNPTPRSEPLGMPESGVIEVPA